MTRIVWTLVALLISMGLYTLFGWAFERAVAWLIARVRATDLPTRAQRTTPPGRESN
jgi:hypothetical protein